MDIKNKQIHLLIMASVFVISGCASYGTPEERAAWNRDAASYSLCERLALSTSAPAIVRNEWAQELEKRDENCQRFAASINAAALSAAAEREAQLNRSMYLLGSGLRMMQPPQQYAPSNVTCSQNGMYTNCTRW